MITTPDFGPVYAETDLTRFPVEPFNTFSNLIFLLIVIYFVKKIKGNYKKYPLITFSLPLIFTGFIGGTIYHATRSSPLWLRMDYIPIIITVSGATNYFWQKLLNSILFGTVVWLLIVICGNYLPMFIGVSGILKISIIYTLLAASLLLPLFILEFKFPSPNKILLVYTVISFTCAVIFRSVDSFAIISHGTHFLWHIFGGISVWCLLEYVYRGGKV